jgi:hypothetical protein
LSTTCVTMVEGVAEFSGAVFPMPVIFLKGVPIKTGGFVPIDEAARTVERALTGAAARSAESAGPSASAEAVPDVTIPKSFNRPMRA